MSSETYLHWQKGEFLTGPALLRSKWLTEFDIPDLKALSFQIMDITTVIVL